MAPYDVPTPLTVAPGKGVPVSSITSPWTVRYLLLVWLLESAVLEELQQFFSTAAPVETVASANPEPGYADKINKEATGIQMSFLRDLGKVAELHLVSI